METVQQNNDTLSYVLGSAVWKQYNKMGVLHFILVNSSSILYAKNSPYLNATELRTSHLYVSYSWPNGRTNLAEHFFREPMGTLGLT